MDRQRILLVNIGNFETDFLERIAQEIVRQLNYPVQLVESNLDTNEFYNPDRRQYDGNQLLYAVNDILVPEALKKMALFNVDLFIPILTYIFGQAVFKGNIGIASAYRLHNELYGLNKDDDLVFSRFTKVIIHELGHTFGLIHCHSPNCVMRSTTYVEDIDQKEMAFCSNCKGLIELP